MGNKSAKLALLLCIVLFAAALLLNMAFSGDEAGEFEAEVSNGVILSEILASNRTYPAPDGRFLDFIEVRNVSNEPADISGFMLSDDAESIGYTFPPETVIQPNGYLVVWCDKESDGERYAAFGISREGGDVIYLYNDDSVVVDQKEVPRMNANVSLVRRNDGSWENALQATPGYENSEKGYGLWLHEMGADEVQVVFSEIMTSNSCTAPDKDGRLYDWLELYNVGKKPAVLDGAYLSNDPEDPAKWEIVSLTLQPGERIVIPCAGTEAQAGEATFALEREGCSLVLTGSLGNTICTAECPQIPQDCSWALQGDNLWQTSDKPTPGFENSEAGYGEWLRSVGADNVNVIITEVMTANYSTVTNQAGVLCDWIELWNAGETAAVLDGGYLSDDPSDRAMWKISSLTLQPGERVVIPCSGTDAPAGEADFALAAGGCSVVLTGANGNVISSVECPRLGDDRVWALQEDGSWLSTDKATPGYENSEAGREAWVLSTAPSGPLAIMEVMSSNRQHLRQSDGKYYDWVELMNISDSAIDLSDFALSDDRDEPYRFTLPQKTLEPGERIVIICSGKPELTGNYAHAPFALSSEECWVYVTGPDGTYSDYMRLYGIPYQGSAGRMEGENGTYYFTTPTPDARNGSGVAFVAETPTFLTAEGVYNDVEHVVVELSGSGEIHYTLDGSIPTARSAVYTEPLKLSSTAVVRAVSVADGKLNSETATASYIINENHTLPVASLTADPNEYAGMYTNYTRDIEIPCNLTLFEEAGTFNIDCGVKMHGHTGLQAPKKSFKVNFRGSYGSNYLSYPVYGEDGPQLYASLCIRAGQDYMRSIFRDELFGELCRQMGDNVLVQQNKFCILYVNGKYQGIHCIKEAFSETYYAENRGVSEESVTIEQAPVSIAGEFYQLISFCRKNDMSKPENYAYICSQVNIESLIDWIIIQGYSTNGDVQQNLRWFKSSENGGRWEPALYDLDWAFYYHNPFRHVLSTEKEWQHLGMTVNLLDNPEFRAQLLSRLSELMGTVLSDENALAVIDMYAEQLAPEIEREKERWGGNYQIWEDWVNKLRDFIKDDHLGSIVDRLRQYIGLTNKEAETYFARWD